MGEATVNVPVMHFCGHAGLRNMALLNDTSVLVKALSLNIDGERI